MTTTATRHLTFAVATAALAGAVFATSLAAQGAPPPKPARDSQPALKQLKPASPPPSTVAPRPRAQVRSTEQAPVELRQSVRVGTPVDSARPVAVPAPRVETMARPAPPPPPVARANPAAQQVTARAGLVSDDPPAGATARCKDGTWLTGVVTESSCADRGGLAVRVPQKSVPRPPNP